MERTGCPIDELSRIERAKAVMAPTIVAQVHDGALTKSRKQPIAADGAGAPPLNWSVQPILYSRFAGGEFRRLQLRG